MTAPTVLITGNTFPVKGHLYAIGGRWNRVLKGWDVPAERETEARNIVAGGSIRRVQRYGDTSEVSNVTRFSSGAVVYTNKRGRCEDAPCCGCCT